MAKLLTELTHEELEALCREQACDICILADTKMKVLEKNKQLAGMVVRLEAENAQLIMILRNNGLI